MPKNSTKMAMAETFILSFLLANLAILPAAAVPASDCPQACNGVTIPYPFGIGDDCSLDTYFNVTCKNSDAGTLTPFYGTKSGHSEGLAISNISLDGFLLVKTFAANDCYVEDTSSIGEIRHTAFTSWANTGKFPLSTTRNLFTALGCDTAAFLWNTFTRGQSGCITVCEDESSVVDGECNGVGCCQTSITEGIHSINISLTSFQNLSKVRNFDPCSFAFLVDKDSYSFKKSDFWGLQSIPMVRTALDWSIGFSNCSDAKANITTYACKDNSNCYDSDDGTGYRCNCTDGYRGNPYLGCEDINECDDPERYPCKGKCKNTPGNYSCVEPVDHTLKNAVIGGGAGITVMLILGLALCVFLKRRRDRKRKEQYFIQNGGLSLQDSLNRQRGSVNTVKIFTVEELEKATDNFSEDRIAGRGGFGTVYRGNLPDGAVVAVKKSKVVDQGQIDQFINEVMVISQINHRNVVRLLGCCLETPVPLLVYEFVSNGTLYDHLHNEQERMPWETRLRVATETAGVLAYLHSAHTVPIIHRDIKPMNILLDDNCIAKVSDFGTSRLVPQNEDELCTMVQGTMGYLDPEYMHTSQLTEKSDVYSFGVVLVELLTGEKAVSFERVEEERSLVMYFMAALREERLLEILDKRIVSSEEKLEQMKEVANIALSCLRVRGEERPTMKEVARELEGLRSVVKHKWVDDGEERKHLLSVALAGYDGNTSYGGTTSGFSSTVDHIMLMPIGDGR